MSGHYQIEFMTRYYPWPAINVGKASSTGGGYYVLQTDQFQDFQVTTIHSSCGQAAQAVLNHTLCEALVFRMASCGPSHLVRLHNGPEAGHTKLRYSCDGQPRLASGRSLLQPRRPL